MDTKSTKISRILSGIAFLLIPVFCFLSVLILAHSHLRELFNHHVLKDDATVTHWENYAPDWSIFTFYSLEEEILGLEDCDYSGYYQQFGDNLLYYAQNLKTGKILTNQETFSGSAAMTLEEFRNICRMKDVYDYGEYVDGILTDSEAGYPNGIERFWDGASPLEETLVYDGEYKYVDSAYKGQYEIAYAFKSWQIGYTEQIPETDYYVYQRRALLGGTLGAITLLLLAFWLLNKRARQETMEKTAAFLSHIWLELKLVVGLAAGLVFLFLAYDIASTQLNLTPLVLLFGSTAAVWFCLYAVFADLSINKKLVFRKSMCYSIYAHSKKAIVGDGTHPSMTSKAYRRVRRGLRNVQKRERERILAMPYQKRLHINLIKYLVGVASIMLGTFLLFFVISGFVFPFSILSLIALSYWFYKRYAGFLEDSGKIAQHIRYLRGGNLDRKITLPSDSKILSMAEDLNNLQEGLQNEIEKRMVSEKMKVELITNVSHDLKTPLTSMINYIDLLKEEKLEPDYANDYVKVLDEKSKRLKLLIENIFDISKAASGNMPVHYERLDVAELVNQTLAECEDSLALSELSIRKNFTDEKFYAYADGKMLWRVAENVIGNAAKYSLPGTRVYLELSEGNKYVCLTVKNIAGYEMNFTSDAIVERFVRGDASRTTSGTGLGLSIVKSFVEAMGGTVNINIDGDLFKISVCVQKYQG